MTAAARLAAALWLRVCAWRADYWLQAWRGRVEAAEQARERYRIWCARAGCDPDITEG